MAKLAIHTTHKHKVPSNLYYSKRRSSPGCSRDVFGSGFNAKIHEYSGKQNFIKTLRSVGGYSKQRYIYGHTHRDQKIML